MKFKKTLIALCIGALAVFGLSSAALASGSDSATPYTVSADGITLPAGATFQDNGHVNVHANQGNKGIHFESLNNQPSGQWIGQSFLPWSAFGYDASTLCVTWVQIAEYNEHFGEGGQKPVGAGCEVKPSPQPSTTPTEEPPTTTTFTGTSTINCEAEYLLFKVTNTGKIDGNAFVGFDTNGDGIADIVDEPLLSIAPGTTSTYEYPFSEIEDRVGFPFTPLAFTAPGNNFYVGDTVEAFDCEPPVVTPNPANPTANLTAVCGSAFMVLTNPLISDANQLTASFVVYIDGEYVASYALEAGQRYETQFEFGEDTGNHKIEVFQAGTSEWKRIAEATVTSDCEEPPVVVPPTEPPVTEPPVITPPTEEPPAEIAEGEEFLATTGLSGGEVAWLVVAGLLIAGAGTALVVHSRKKAKQ